MTRRSEVTELLDALREGRMSLEGVAERFRERDWPRKGPRPSGYLERAAAELEDPEPDTPGSFDDVNTAYYAGEITDEQYDVLARAMAEAKRRQDAAND